MPEINRLPQAMRDVGGQVSVALPLEERSVAHRVRWEPLGRKVRGSDTLERLALPRCQERPYRRAVWAPFSAGWADHLGALACPAAECFGGAGGDG